jgi:hypothetical protein
LNVTDTYRNIADIYLNVTDSYRNMTCILECEIHTGIWQMYA